MVNSSAVNTDLERGMVLCVVQPCVGLVEEEVKDHLWTFLSLLCSCCFFSYLFLQLTKALNQHWGSSNFMIGVSENTFTVPFQQGAMAVQSSLLYERSAAASPSCLLRLELSVPFALLLIHMAPGSVVTLLWNGQTSCFFCKIYKIFYLVHFILQYSVLFFCY